MVHPNVIQRNVKRLAEGLGHHDAGRLRRLWLKVSGGRRPSAKTLDRLALLAGFQNWREMKSALRGEDVEL